MSLVSCRVRSQEPKKNVLPLPDRAAERPAELIQPNRRLRRRKEVLGVERIVRSDSNTVPRNRFVPDRVDIDDDAAGRVAVLGGVVVA